MIEAVTQLLNALSLASLLYFVASGFTVVFGMMRVANLAHGGFFLLGGYIGWTIVDAGAGFLVAVVVSTVALGGVGWVLEAVALRRVRGDELREVLLTFGVAMIISDQAIAIWGGNSRTIPRPEWLTGPVRIGAIVYPAYRLALIVVAVVVGVVLMLLYKRTRLGAIVRAGVDDREMAGAMGINVDRLFGSVFSVGAGLAGLGGVMGGALLGLLPGAEMSILLLTLVVVIIGGIGSLAGVAVGSVLVGVLETFGRAYFPELSYFTLFAPMALLLIWRPQGLLGSHQSGGS